MAPRPPGRELRVRSPQLCFPPMPSRSFLHRQPTMASDHQTQAGKPQPLNPKVGTMRGPGAAQRLSDLLSLL